MREKNVSKTVKRITITSKSGVAQPVVIYKKERKRKVSEGLKPLEKTVRDVVRATNTSVANYLKRHERSNRKRKDGWLYDLTGNIARSADDYFRVLKWK